MRKNTQPSTTHLSRLDDLRERQKQLQESIGSGETRSPGAELANYLRARKLEKLRNIDGSISDTNSDESHFNVQQARHMQ